MEKSFALVMPDRPGMLRELMRMLSANAVEVLRMSYNRIVDVHAVFVDVTGSMAALESVEDELRAWRFLPGQREVGEVRLLELSIGDEPQLLEPVLALVEQREFNITYVDVRTDGVGNGIAQVGIYVRDLALLDGLVSDAQRICPARLIPHDSQPNMLDTNHFYLSFAHGLAKRMGLSAADENEILVNSNRIMQNLMSRGTDPFGPFVNINRIGEAITAFRGPAFAATCRITRSQTDAGLGWVCIEPPIGSDTWVFECDDCLLFIDSGYCCFADEFEGIVRNLYPDWDNRTKKLVLTHVDIDHVGACHLFDEVYASGRTIDSFTFESMGIVSWREQNPMSYPFNRIGCVLSGYRTPAFEHMICLGEPSPFGEQAELLRRIDTLDVAPLSFEVWEGKGGHVRGETILIERKHHVCVSGDIFVNVHNQIKPQARFNTLAPTLMTSVDTKPDLAKEERAAMFDLLGEGRWQVMGGHGALLDWSR